MGAWADVKAAYGEAGIWIYADECVRTEADVAPLAAVSHGLNVKLGATERGEVCGLLVCVLSLSEWCALRPHNLCRHLLFVQTRPADSGRRCG